MTITDELNEILTTFTNKLVDIYNYQGFIESATRLTFVHFNEEMENTKEFISDGWAGSNSLACRSIEDNRMISLGYTENFYEDMIKKIPLHNNKQYQWLLVEAYETFEDFVDELYAYMGYRDHTFWKAADFGNVSINEISNKDLNWLRKCVKNKRGKPETIYEQFRSKMSTIKLLEKKNPQNIDYNFLIVLISKLRHIIVHKRGILNDLEKFINLVLNDAGISIKGEMAKKYKPDILCYIGENNAEKFVLLQKNGYYKLMRGLASYANLLKSFCVKYLSENEKFKELITDEKAYLEFFSSSNLYQHLNKKTTEIK